MRNAIPVLVLLLAMPLTAQATVSPKDAVGAGANSRGVSGLGYGFNLSAHHLQQLHDSDSFSHGVTPFSMRSIGLRMPRGRNTGGQGGARVDVAIQLSLAPANVNANARSATFANNRDARTMRLVFRKKTVLLPKLGTPQKPSTGFDFRLKFDAAPFLYLPSQKRALVLDLFNYTIVRGSNNYFVDGWTRARSGLSGAAKCALLSSSIGSSANFGISTANGAYTGCTSSKRVRATHASDPGSLLVGHRHVFEGGAGIANAAGVMVLGARSLSARLPGTACDLKTDILLLVPFVANGAGDGIVPFAFPAGQRFVGASFFTQFVFVDAAANRLGLVTSNSLRNQLGRGFGDSARTNFLGRALIVEFRR